MKKHLFTSFFFSVFFLIFYSCQQIDEIDNSVINNPIDQLEYTNAFQVEGLLKIAETSNSELVLSVHSNNQEDFSFIAQDSRLTDELMSFDNKNILFIHNGSSLTLIDPENKVYTLYLNGRVTQKDYQFSDKEKILSDLEKQYTVVKNEGSESSNGLHIIEGFLDISNEFKENHNSVFELLNPEVDALSVEETSRPAVTELPEKL